MVTKISISLTFNYKSSLGLIGHILVSKLAQKSLFRTPLWTWVSSCYIYINTLGKVWISFKTPVCKNQCCLRSSCLYICDCRRTQTRMQTPCPGSHSLRIKLLTTHILIHAGFMHTPDLMEIVSGYRSATRKDQSYSQLLKKQKRFLFCREEQSNFFWFCSLSSYPWYWPYQGLFATPIHIPAIVLRQHK